MSLQSVNPATGEVLEGAVNVSRTSPVAGLTDCRLMGPSFYLCSLRRAERAT